MNFRLVYFLLVFVLAIAADSNKALDEKNGFKKYKLGTPINSYPGFKISNEKPSTDSCSLLYEKTPELSDNIGEVKVSKIIATTSRDTVVKIEVPLAEANIPKLLEVFSKEFGKYTTSDNAGDPSYKWEGDNVKMILIDKAHRRGNKEYAKGPADVFTITSKDAELIRRRCVSGK